MPPLSYQAFSQQALYGPQGYYTAARTRVGRARGADFYTASCFPLFSQLVHQAFTQLAHQHGLASPALLELGPEPGAALFPMAPAGFSQALHYPLGTLEVFSPPGPCIIFSNELFDAQPFERVQLTAEGWQLLGLDPHSGRIDIPLGPVEANLARLLPSGVPVGSVLDISPAAVELIERLCQPAWAGLFIVFDYGLPLAQLQAHPRPTARAYHQHRQLSLAQALRLPAGSYDITHHIIWDHLAQPLQAHGCRVQPLLSQESFFVRYASHAFPALQPHQRPQLATLLHPGHMGAQFQVLVASRGL